MPELEKWKRIGERVGALIRARGYKTVELFAHENDLDKSVLNRLIRGKREVRLSTFLRILEALEISLPELQAGGGAVREREPGYDVKGGKPKRPEAGGKVFRFTRDEFDRIEVRKSARDKSPVIMEAEGKKSRSLALKSKSLRLEL